LDTRPECRRVEDGLRDAATGVRELARRQFGRPGRAEIHAADDAAARVTDEVDLRRVDVAARDTVEIELAERSREGKQIDSTLAEVVAGDERIRHVDEVRAGAVDRAIRPRSAGRIVDEVEVERELAGRVIERVGGDGGGT